MRYDKLASNFFTQSQIQIKIVLNCRLIMIKELYLLVKRITRLFSEWNRKRCVCQVQATKKQTGLCIYIHVLVSVFIYRLLKGRWWFAQVWFEFSLITCHKVPYLQFNLNGYTLTVSNLCHFFQLGSSLQARKNAPLKVYLFL